MGDFFGLGIVAVAVGSAAIGAGRKVLERRRARRELREKQPLSARSPEGQVVRVTGVVEVLDGTLEAPLSGKSCVVYRARVSAGGKLTSRAQRPKELAAMIPFVIDRGAQGRVVIEGNHALLDVAPLSMRRDKIDPERRSQLLVRVGYALRELGRAHYDETVIEPGMRVSVAGLMMKDLVTQPVNDELGFRDAPPTNLRLAGNVEHPLVIGDPVD